MAIIVNGDPYVHSLIYNFNRQVKNDFDTDNAESRGQQELEKQINALKQISKQLKDAADSFMGTDDYKTFSNNILNNQSSFSNIAFKIFRDPKLINKLTQISKKDLEKVLKSNGLGNKILNNIEKEAPTKAELKQAVSSAISGYNFNITLSEQFTKIKGTFQNLPKELEEEFFKIYTRKIRKGSKNTIAKAITDLIQKEVESKKQSGPLLAWEYFEDQFRQQVKQSKITIVNNELEDYLKALKNNFLKRASNFKFSESAGASGFLGEEGIAAVIETESNGFEVKVVGNLFEEATKANKQTVSELYNIPQMKTHHSKNTFSQTDLILTNTSNNKVVRVQSKNAVAVLNKILPNLNDEKISAPPQWVALQKDVKLIELYNLLGDTRQLTEQDFNDLKYLLANEVWFHVKGSYEEKTGRKLTGEKSEGGLTGAQTIVSRILTKEVGNFLGITFSESFGNAQVITGGSNIFFLFGNAILVPTYLIIDQLIDSISQIEGALFQIRPTLDWSGINFGGYNAKTLYKEKQVKTGGLDPSKNYSEGNLLSVGTNAGSAIVNSLNIKKINLKVNLKTLLSSVYNFTP